MASILDTAETTLREAGDITVEPAFRDFPLVLYEAVAASSRMAAFPRFGHSSNISLLFSDNDLQASQARDDYITGLLYAGAFVLAIFVFWSVVLLIFKLWGCCCRTKFPGFLSGNPFTLYEDEEPTKARLRELDSRSNFIRLIFLICGVILMVFSILLATNGFQDVENTRSVADKSLDDVRVLMAEAIDVSEELRGIGESTIELRDKLVVELGKERLCPNDPTYLTQDLYTMAVQENAEAAIDMLDMLGEFSTREIKRMDDGLASAGDVIDQIDVIVESAADKQWMGVFFIAPLITFTALLMAGTLAASRQVQTPCYECTLSYVVLPMFVVWIVASYILCGGLALSASANADVCSGGSEVSPDGTVMAALQNLGLNETSFEFQIARYYVRQCTADAKVDPFLFLREHEAEITVAHTIVQNLSTSLEIVDIDTISFVCGRDFEPLSSSLDTMLTILEGLKEAVGPGLSLLSCDRIVPIYAEVMYDGACKYSITGLTWMFYSLLIISTMGLTMIMLRSSYLNNLVLPDFGRTEGNTSKEFKIREYDVVKMANHEEAMSRGQALALQDAARESQFKETQHWQQHVDRLNTSDSGSVYTDGNGDLNVFVGEASPSRRSPNLAELEENSYDTRGNIRPSAPYEFGMVRYDQYDS